MFTYKYICNHKSTHTYTHLYYTHTHTHTHRHTQAYYTQTHIHTDTDYEENKWLNKRITWSGTTEREKVKFELSSILKPPKCPKA